MRRGVTCLVDSCHSILLLGTRRSLSVFLGFCSCWNVLSVLKTGRKYYTAVIASAGFFMLNKLQ